MADISYSVFEKIVQKSLWGTECGEISDVDWSELLLFLNRQGVLAFPGKVVSQLDVPEKNRVDWIRQVRITVQRFFAILKKQQELTDLLRREHIVAVVLKGTSAAMYYTNPSFRTMGDIDFMVFSSDGDSRESVFDKALDLLIANGYSVGEDIVRHVELEKDGIRFEMHRYFAAHMKPDEEKWLNDYIFARQSGITIREFSGNHWYSFDTITNGLILLQHLRQHMVSGLGVRHICDWMMFVYRNIDSGNVTEFMNLAQKCGNAELMVTMTALCEKHLGLPGKREWCETADESIIEIIWQHVLKDGDHGANDSLSEVRDSLVTYRKHPIKTLQRNGLINMGKAANNKFLRPFAWLYQSVHILRKVLFERNYSPRKLKKVASQVDSYCDVIEYLGIGYD